MVTVTEAIKAVVSPACPLTTFLAALLLLIMLTAAYQPGLALLYVHPYLELYQRSYSALLKRNQTELEEIFVIDILQNIH